MKETVLAISQIGGLFAVLTFLHFLIDWTFQSHAEAMVKHNNPKVRAKHCLIYTLGFLPIMYLFGFQWWEYLLATNILFWSHFGEDTYYLIFLWAKYIRKPPEMQTGTGGLSKELVDTVVRQGFVSFVSTPLGKILMITMDQIVHLAFLFPVAYLAWRHINR